MQAIVSFSKERGEWMAVIVNGAGETVCIGCELTEAAAKKFAADALAFHQTGEGSHPSDMYDRASTAGH